MSQIKFDLIHINKYYYLIRSYLLALTGGVHAAAAAAGAGAGVGW
jgi:formate dehydrogenase assembly factor FdhD